MKIIYKYPFKVFDVNARFAIEMPEKAQILSIQMQNGKPYLWALVNTDNPLNESLEDRTFVVCGTGQQIYGDTSSYKYLSTIQDGNYVWHIFEVENI